MALIFNTDGTTRTVVPLAVEPNGTVEFSYLIACRSGYVLSSEAIAGLALEARKTGDLAWTDLESTAIDLSADAGADVIYEFKATAGAAAVLANCLIRVGPAPDEDTEAPTVPANLTATAQSDTEILLDWDASTDNEGVAGYEYRVDGGTPVDVGALTTANVTGLTAETEYDFEVRAYDEAENYSDWSAAVSETTEAAPILPDTYRTAFFPYNHLIGSSGSIGAVHGYNTGDLTLNFAPHFEPGDILHLKVLTNPADAVAAPAGWTECTDSPVIASDCRMTLFWRRMEAGDAQVTVADSGDHQLAVLAAYRNAIETGDPWHVTSATTGAQSGGLLTLDGLTTSVNNCLVVLAVGAGADQNTEDIDEWTNADLDNLEAFSLQAYTPSESKGNISVTAGEKLTAGAVGQSTVGFSQSTGFAGWVGALLPAAQPRPCIAGIGSTSGSTGSTSLILPNNYKDNDLLLAFIETQNQAPTLPSPWAELTGSPVANAGTNPTRLTAFYRRASGSAGFPSIGDSGDHQFAINIAVRNVIRTGDPADVTSSATGTGTSITIPGASTSLGGCLVLAAVATARDAIAFNFSNWANADLENFAEKADQSTTSGGGGGLGLASGIKQTAGAYGDTTVTQATATDWAGYTVALKPEE